MGRAGPSAPRGRATAWRRSATMCHFSRPPRVLSPGRPRCAPPATAPEGRFGPALALLAGLVADGALKPQVVEHSWRELARIGPRLLGRQIPGKAVFHIEQN